MAKEKSRDPDREARKLAKAEKKAKRSETDGIHKSKSDKKEKKEKTAAAASDAEVTTKLLNAIEESKPGSVAVREENGDVRVKVKTEPLLGALVPFANPLADEKVGKKVLKSVKKGSLSPAQGPPETNHSIVTATKNKSLKRGVKEVVKSLRKSSTATATTGTDDPPAIVVLAADISPMDVISHIPVLCEDHGVPYIYVTSRAELGAAASTNRPTSVVMITQEAMGKKKGGGEKGDEEFKDVYKDLAKIVVKASRDVRI